MESGTQLGHYTILSAIGKGGMGAVWCARDAKLGREVKGVQNECEFGRRTKSDRGSGEESC